MAKLYVNASARKNKINKNIYGHFSEHLGRCIYNGLYLSLIHIFRNQMHMHLTRFII